MNVVGVLTRGRRPRLDCYRWIYGGGRWTRNRVGGPLLGAAADRFGQRYVMLLSGLGNAAVALLVDGLGRVCAGIDGWLLAVAVLVGATAPQVGPMSRTRLVTYITRMPKEKRGKTLQSTFAYESAVDEIVFIFGPVIVGLLATTLNPAAPSLAPPSDPRLRHGVCASPFSKRDPARRPRVTAHCSGAGSRTVSVSHHGGGFGHARHRILLRATLTSLTSWMEDRGAEQTGLLYGLMGVTSAALALGVALFRRGSP